MAKAMAVYIDVHGRDYDLAVYEDYCQKTRYLSDKTYQLHKDEINPLGLPRGLEYHLDHIVPIIEGFKRGLPPEAMAVKENLQMLPAKENLSKGKYV